MEPRPLLCDSEATLATALPFLQGCSTLILDCEGLQLGQRGGSLSLVTLRTTAPSPIRTYIIDITSLPRTALQPVFDILRSPTACKVLFDGRMDYSALYHEYGVELTNLLDVQLVDVASRQTRGEGQAAQFRRLQKYLPYINLHSNIETYQQVHKLSGLDECVGEHNVTTSMGTGKRSVDHARWLLRPLPQSYLSYASADVALIHALYNKFLRLRYITPVLASQSEVYITVWKAHQPASHETHLRHPLLPLGVLNPSDARSSTITCTVCTRALAKTAFPALGRNYISERRCWVCRAVAAKNNGSRQSGGDLEEHFASIQEQIEEQENDLQEYFASVQEQIEEQENDLQEYFASIQEQIEEQENDLEEYFASIEEQECGYDLDCWDY